MDKYYEVTRLRAGRYLVYSQANGGRIIDIVCIGTEQLDKEVRRLEGAKYGPRGPLARATSQRVNQQKLFV